MDQIQNGPTPEILQSLIANPATANSSNMEELSALVKLYPQCSIFHLLLAKAAHGGEAEVATKTLQTTAVNVANREVLFKLIHHPELLHPAKPEQIFPLIEVTEKAETLKSNASIATVISLSDENEVLVSDNEIVPPIKTNTSFSEEDLVSEHQPETVDAEIDPEPVASFNEENLVSENQPEILDAEIDPNSNTPFNEENLISEHQPEIVEAEIDPNLNTSFNEENLVSENQPEILDAEIDPNLNTSFNEENLVSEHQPEIFDAEIEPEPVASFNEENLVFEHQPEIPDAEIDPNSNTSFNEEKLVSENQPEIVDAEIEPEPVASFTEENLVSEYQPESLDAEIEPNSNTSFNEENLVSEHQPETVDAEIDPNPNTSFTEEEFVKDDQLATVDPEFELNPEEEMAVENDLRVEDVNLNFVNTDAEVDLPAELKAKPVLIEETQEVSPTETIVTEAEQSELPATAVSNEIDEEVFEEIMAIEDMDFHAIKTVSPPAIEAEPQPKTELQPETEPQPKTETEEKPAFTIQDKAEKDMLSSIASIDYFTFNNKFGQNQTPSIQEKAEEKQEIALAKPEPAEPETVAKYDDDKMPYTFMWWLDKTRKEYAGTYQPYIKNQQQEKANSNLSVGPELHQQYIESIFHTKPPHEMAESSLPLVVESPIKRKEDDLIKRFIIQEPHIHPPSNDKLDTENKAKKSSEDADILVTETLAKIYLDQMLYHKALDTYKKLLLKFPEKSRYFTAQIELIEKKIN